MRASRTARHLWRNRSLEPVLYEFEVKQSANAVGVSVWRNDKRIVHSRYRWGPSKADAFAMAAHKCDPAPAVGAFHYLFGDAYLTALFAESQLNHNNPA